MRKGRRVTEEKQKVFRNRSDLTIDEFGANTRNKDDSLSGNAMSGHWNPDDEAEV
jgi:hypothetical protein